jgi:hypothetical protein
MLMDEFKTWRYRSDNHSALGSEESPDNFSIFYQEYTVGKNFMEMLNDLAYQIYELQTCMEGILEEGNY